MRKETQKIAQAFKDGKPLKMARTECTGNMVLLHGNMIAKKHESGDIVLTLAGWPTVTTRERLNGIVQTLGIKGGFSQRKGVQYFDNESIGPNQEILITKDKTQ